MAPRPATLPAQPGCTRSSRPLPADPPRGLLAPVYARHRPPGPVRLQPLGDDVVDGKTVEVIQQGAGRLGLGETPMGPTWQTNYFIGADAQGRDVMARVLYGGRLRCRSRSLRRPLLPDRAGARLIGGFLKRWWIAVSSRFMDPIWAFPVYLLAITLATVLSHAAGRRRWWFIHIDPSSLWVPTVILAGRLRAPTCSGPCAGQVLSVARRSTWRRRSRRAPRTSG